MLLNVVFVVLGLGALVLGGDLVVKGAARLASSFGVSALVIGVSVVAFGTSTPELLVNLSAASQGVVSLALGNIVGSNIANIGLILGLTGVIFPIAVQRSILQREIPIMIAVSLVAFVMVLDREVSRIDGIILALGFVGFSLLAYRLAMRERGKTIQSEIVEFETMKNIAPPPAAARRGVEVARLGAGIVLLMIGARLMVDGATALAQAVGVSETVIGLTLVAFGTSLPELAASLMAAFRKENDIAMGNIVGSNIANLLFILGATALVQPIPVNDSLQVTDLAVMIMFSVVLVPMALNLKLTRLECALLLVGYGVFIVWSFVR